MVLSFHIHETALSQRVFAKQAVSDKALGGLMLLVASTVFTYYTTWAMLLVRFSNLPLFCLCFTTFQPFFDSSNPIHSWFPPREWAVRLPAFILVLGLSAIGFFLGSTIIKEKQRKAQQAKLRMA